MINFKLQFCQAHQEFRETTDTTVEESEIQQNHVNLVHQEVVEGIQSAMTPADTTEPSAELIQQMANSLNQTSETQQQFSLKSQKCNKRCCNRQCNIFRYNRLISPFLSNSTNHIHHIHHTSTNSSINSQHLTQEDVVMVASQVEEDMEEEAEEDMEDLRDLIFGISVLIVGCTAAVGILELHA